MRVVETPAGGKWVIARGRKPVLYFSFLADGKPSWTKLLFAAMRFDTKEQATIYVGEIRKRARSSSHWSVMKPHDHGKSRAEYVWTKADKKLLVWMFFIGCKPAAMAAQFNRTAAACRSMYNLIARKADL